MDGAPGARSRPPGGAADHGGAHRVGAEERQLRRPRLARVLPDAHEHLEPGRLRRLPRPSRAAAQVVHQPGARRPEQGGLGGQHQLRPGPEQVGRLGRGRRAAGGPVPRALPDPPRPGRRVARRGQPERARRASRHDDRRSEPVLRRPPGRGRPDRVFGRRPAGAADRGEVHRHALPLGRRHAGDRFRLLGARRIQLRAARHPHPPGRRGSVQRGHPGDQGRAEAGRHRLLQGLDRLRPSRGDLHRERHVPGGPAHRRRGQDLEPRHALLRAAVRGRPRRLGPRLDRRSGRRRSTAGELRSAAGPGCSGHTGSPGHTGRARARGRHRQRTLRHRRRLGLRRLRRGQQSAADRPAGQRQHGAGLPGDHDPSDPLASG